MFASWFAVVRCGLGRAARSPTAGAAAVAGAAALSVRARCAGFGAGRSFRRRRCRCRRSSIGLCGPCILIVHAGGSCCCFGGSGTEFEPPLRILPLWWLLARRFHPDAVTNVGPLDHLVGQPARPEHGAGPASGALWLGLVVILWYVLGAFAEGHAHAEAALRHRRLRGAERRHRVSEGREAAVCSGADPFYFCANHTTVPPQVPQPRK